MEVFESFETPQKSSILSRVFFFLGPMFPVLLKLPTQNTLIMRRLKYSMKGIADNLLEKTKSEMKIDSEGLGAEEKGSGDKSIIGLLSEVFSASLGLITS